MFRVMSFFMMILSTITGFDAYHIAQEMEIEMGMYAILNLYALPLFFMSCFLFSFKKHK